ncbi:hypothetical protein CcaverHIS002_0204070 [Cutaneotrichosporon cavernicola]|uniref:Uncharacterized protein n=1 Tax=Cutaneotrichosporon cavernicola TaxID=279322 RepID=A0AA48IIE9_9TREE|nr:uncharacterized protein CcaverHIS019_0204050 [Cutaneotrichosporon cavernicola]BEI81247.1 hypothetical protein CcaverHIS002_0204070 [Cutaneotrichosporon cavernicola]BEI89043.1 hypothetical protein CcaverHIS019_0204050 [Cutaneotrichosporon cavernicola]BEI96818.1 hypothetical protein CcaverHIS631_0204070 [Cutaneotrichosporon cavernicola]BEJ04590.1 hypothetical protein CcaverHIS641_0204070 [Cutaneotrichosporon cavernicola]
MASLLRSYGSFMTRRPFLGNIVSAVALFGAGDVIAQQAVEKKGWSKHDWARTGRIVTWGGVFFAPAVTAWFQVLNKVPMTNMVKGTAIRVGLDQFVAAPIVLSCFYTVMTLLEGKDLATAKEKAEKNIWPTLKVNWSLFVPVQAINQSVVPLHYRLVVINVVNLFFNTFLSLQNAKGDVNVPSPKPSSAR